MREQRVQFEHGYVMDINRSIFCAYNQHRENAVLGIFSYTRQVRTMCVLANQKRGESQLCKTQSNRYPR